MGLMASIFLIFSFMFFSFCGTIFCSRSAVVHIDMRYSFLQLDPQTHKGRKYTYMRVGDTDVVCGDLAASATRFNRSDLVLNNTFGNKSNHWSSVEQMWTLESQTMRYLVLSKTAWLTDQCFFFRNFSDVRLVYDVCIGRSVGMFYAGSILLADAAREPYREIGFYDPYLDEVYANGTVVQHYIKKESNSRARVIMSCGLNTPREVTSMVQDRTGDYVVHLQAPSFCDWRDPGVGTPSRRLELYPLLQNLKGWCTDFTADEGYTYRYCFPDSLTRFSTFGGLNTSLTSNETLLIGRKRTSTQLGVPFLGSSIMGAFEHETATALDTLPLKREKMSGIFLDMSFKPSESVLGHPLECLVLEITSSVPYFLLPHGEDYYQAEIYFYCPSQVLKNTAPRITHLRQVSLFKYKIYIATPLVCCHPALLPRVGQLPETVVCYPATQPVKPPQQPLTRTPSTPVYQQEMSDTIHTDSELRNVILNNSVELVSDLLQTVLYRDLQAEPLAYEFRNHLSLDTHAIGFLSNGLYIRLRNETFPRFFLGLPVRHQRLNVMGIIVGWDPQCRVPIRRLYEYELVYSKDRLSSPHYLIRIVNFSDSRLTEKYIYSPEFVLEPLNVNKLGNSTFLNELLGAFDASINAFTLNRIILSKNIIPETSKNGTITLEMLYPEDIWYSSIFSDSAS